MTILSFLFQKQTHKAQRGYYINHDNLLAASVSDRRLLIFYFIAEQTPEKLTKADKQAYDNERGFLDNVTAGLAFVGGALGVLTRPTVTKTRPYVLLNLISYGIRFVLFSGLTYTVALSLSEQRFIARNPVVHALAEKYHFSVYDFALAKKESRIKSIKNQLTSQYALL